MIGFSVFICLYAVSCILHLIFCFLENEKFRKWSKCFCMGLLAIAVFFIAHDHPLIYISIILGFLGDLFLLKKDNSFYLTLGATSFAAMHGMNMYIICSYLSYSVNWSVFVISLVGLITFLVYGKLTKRKVNPIVRKGALGYFFLLLFAAIIACLLLIDTLNFGSILIFSGYLLFLCSDICLVIFNYVHHVKRKHFWVMLTYLSAQTLIYIGMILLI